MEWGAPTVGRLSLAPGFAGVAEDFQQCFVVFFIVGKYRFGIDNDQDVPFGLKPFEIGQTLFQGVPVVSEVIRKGERSRELIEETRWRPAFLSLDGTHGKPWRRFHRHGS